MQNKNEIIISLDEYKELLLKDKPNNTDTMLLDRIKILILENIEYDEDWNKDVRIDFKSVTSFTDELLTTIKVIDKEFYKDMIKHICDEKQKKEEEKAKMKKARAIKEIENN